MLKGLNDIPCHVKLHTHTFLFFLFTALPLWAGSVDDIEFSVERGFYDAPFDVVLSTETSDATIFYTLDGSDPCGSATAQSGPTPVTLTIDPNSTYGGLRPQTPAVTLKACGSAPSETKDSDIAVSTYLFIDEVVQQSSGDPGSGWPAPNTGSGQFYDYGMDQSVASFNEIKNSLMAVPTISMVTELSNLFDSQTGIYENPFESGGDWERPGSIELINPDGSKGFQQNCGLRIRGGFSRSEWNPKHSFKAYFDKDYGEKYLEFPLFGDEGVQKYRKIGFATAQNYSWSMWGDAGLQNTFLREPLARDIQAAQGRLHAKSFNFHLYVNGMYWGLYLVQEAASAKFAAQYLGDNKDFYDVIKTDDWKVEATDGTLDIYNDLYDKVKNGVYSNSLYYELQGLASNGIDKDPAHFHYLDAENLIDYMLAIYHSGDADGPISKYWGNAGVNNFYGIISQVNPIGFQWIRHDAEHSFDTGDWSRIGPYNLNGRDYFNPQTLHEKLIVNDEYKMLFSDLAYRSFYNNGPMTPDSAMRMIQRRKDVIDGAITAEAARWGDQQSAYARTKSTWLGAVADFEYNVNNRTDIVKQQLKSIGWFTYLKPPVAILDASGAEIDDRFIPASGDNAVVLSPLESNSTIYYTIDGTDPRAPGGSVSYTALFGGTSVIVADAKLIKTRIYHTTQGWSPVREIFFTESIGSNVIKFSEIHYKPDEQDGDIDENALEFIEIKNASSESVSLAGAKLSKGVLYAFPAETVLAPNEYYVIAKNPGEFIRRYGFTPNGHYSDELDNGDEAIEMVDAFNGVMDYVEYEDEGAWPESPDGDGPSLNIVNGTATTNSNDPASWQASFIIHGTPGSENPAVAPYLASISVSPTEALVGIGSIVTLTASATDQYGYEYPVNFTWSTTGAGTVVDGEFSSAEIGIYIVTVEAEGQSATAQIDVQGAPVLTTLSITPGDVTLAIGEAQQFIAEGLDQYNNEFITIINWSVSTTAGSSIITPSGIFRAPQSGNYTIIAESNGIIQTAVAVVSEINLIQNGEFSDGFTNWFFDLYNGGNATNIINSDGAAFIDISNPGPDNWSVQFGQKHIPIESGKKYRYSFDAKAKTARDLSTKIEKDGNPWTNYSQFDEVAITTEMTNYSFDFIAEESDSDARVVFNSGQYSSDITLDNISLVEIPLIVTPELTSIVITPQNPSVLISETQQFTAESFDQFGNPFVAPIVWDVSGTGSITASGLFTPVSGGIFSVTAISGSVGATTTITVVEPPELTSIDLTPTTTTLAIGATQQYIATGIDQYGNEIATAITWSVDGDGTITPNGFYTAGSIGNFSITAAAGALSANAAVTVTDVSIENMLTNGDFTNGWSSWDLGLYEGASASRFTNGSEGTIVINNGGWAVWNIQLRQGGLDLQTGETYRLSFYAKASSARTISTKLEKASAPYTTYAGANGIALTTEMQFFEYEVTMDLTDPVARVSFNLGTNSSDVTVSDVQVVNAPIIVEPPVLDHIVLTPKTLSVTIGETVQYDAQGIDQYGYDYAAAISYSATGGSIDLAGLYTASETGSFVVTAQAGIIETSTPITVSEVPVATSIVVTPVSATIASGDTKDYDAVVYDQYNRPMSVVVTWSVEGDGSINSNGLYTAGSIGDYTITAAVGDVNTTATVSVIELSVVNMLTNGDFSNGWTSWSLGLYEGASASRSIDDLEGTVVINNGGWAVWNVQLRQGDLDLLSGETYRLSFYAKASSSRTISTKLEKASAPYTTYAGAGDIALTTEMQYFEYEVTMGLTDPVARVSFNLGTNTSDVTLADVQVITIP